MKLKITLFLTMILPFFACESGEKKTTTSSSNDKEVITEATQKIGLENGRWISTDDKNKGIQIYNDRLSMFHKKGDEIVNKTYYYELDEKDGIEYLRLKDRNGKVTTYGLLEYSDESMVLSYLDRGSTLTYTKEKE
ncbi:hypothetical protein U8527_07995 [Kordia algicida OT-1]|uniref:Uncharacterized protein n=1 Tax=Kordia algicida OT-1 TaxID=391587 RepID=A9E915_9FLAO|nr:hypothetical protein [Kordia algicida]EDP94845.1 hypothetical protein KAOT1_01425 [Kordia algicida OT-1]